jgi:hypothetical protein
MAGALAQFTASVNQPDLYPDTPFQILYVDPATANGVPTIDGGVADSGSNMFPHVRPGTPYFVPIINPDDSPPVLGTFPTSHEDAIPYVFGHDTYGASFQIIIDGRIMPIGSEYVAGPVTTAPLPDGGGTHMITLGAFVRPLTPGDHTVSITGGVFGDGLLTTYGIKYLTEDFTYKVHVG